MVEGVVWVFLNHPYTKETFCLSFVRQSPIRHKLYFSSSWDKTGKTDAQVHAVQADALKAEVTFSAQTLRVPSCLQ